MKRFLTVLITFCLAISLVACGSSNEDAEKKIYYVRTDKMGIVPIDYEMKATTVNSKVKEVLNMLSTDVDEVEYMAAIPSGVYIEDFDISDEAVTLYMSDSYKDLDSFTEILVRAAIVKSLVQVEGITSVYMYVDSSPLVDSTGSVVSAMTADTFIDDFGTETDSLLSTDLTLYFASADGKTLVPETREVYYSRNVAIEKLILEQLLKGPDTDSLLATIPSGTKILSVSVENDVCYVNMDSTLETTITGVTENVTVYSMVNSLCQLANIKQVQLLVNGEAPHISNVEDDLSLPLSENKDIVNETTTDDDGDEYPDSEVLLDEDGNPVEIDVEITDGDSEN